MPENLKPATEVPHIKYISAMFLRNGKPRYKLVEVNPRVNLWVESGTTAIYLVLRDIRYTRHRYRDKPLRFDMTGSFYQCPIFASALPEFRYKNVVIRYADCPDAKTFCGRVNMVLDNIMLEKEIDAL